VDRTRKLLTYATSKPIVLFTSSSFITMASVLGLLPACIVTVVIRFDRRSKSLHTRDVVSHQGCATCIERPSHSLATPTSLSTQLKTYTPVHICRVHQVPNIAVQTRRQWGCVPRHLPHDNTYIGPDPSFTYHMLCTRSYNGTFTIAVCPTLQQTHCPLH
jgi:hypothetical protein